MDEKALAEETLGELVEIQASLDPPNLHRLRQLALRIRPPTSADLSSPRAYTWFALCAVVQMTRAGAEPNSIEQAVQLENAVGLATLWLQWL